MLDRVKLALRRGLAKADTWAAAVALWFSGFVASGGRWLPGVLLGVFGLVFLVASGDYCWRRGYQAGLHKDGATGR